MKLRIFSIFLFIGYVAQVHANSYVGNGGSEGDVELSVSFAQIKETFSVLSVEAGGRENLCECNATYQARNICEPLNSLSHEQERFCSQTLSSQALQMLSLLNHRDEINFRWTNSAIEVEEAGAKRAADAVASRERKEIVLNLERFLEMKPDERVLLLTHELFHFTDLNGQALTDEGNVGPFTGSQGARHLIDAMSAAATISVAQFPNEIHERRSELDLSQSSKRNWFDLDFGGTSVGGDSSSDLMSRHYNLSELSYRYQGVHWGVMATIRNQLNDSTTIDSINIHEDLTIFGIGPTYRFFLWKDPMTYFGQSHFVIHALAEFVSAQYKISDSYTGANDSTTTIGANLGLTYMLPIYWGFWANIGLSEEFHPYKYKNPLVNLNYNQNVVSAYLGVSYAF